MKKSRLFSLLCAFCPGAGEMYMGLLKRGASIMLLFWGIVALCTLIPYLMFLLPVIWFYSFFDSLNSRHLTPEQLQEIDRHVLDFSNYPNLRKKWSGASAAVRGSTLAAAEHGSTTLTTESSARTRMSRLWSKKQSAIAFSLCRASLLPRAMGSPPALPEVMTRAGIPETGGG